MLFFPLDSSRVPWSHTEEEACGAAMIPTAIGLGLSWSVAPFL